MFCGISGLFGGRFVSAVPFNNLMIASPCGEFADVAFGIAFGLGVVAFLVVVFFLLWWFSSWLFFSVLP